MMRTCGVITVFALLLDGCVESSSSDSSEGEVVTGELLKWFPLGYASESVEYDAINKQYYFAHFPNSISILDGSDIDAILDGSAIIEEDAFDFGDYPLQRPTGMWTDGTTLYLNAGGTGRVLFLDIETRQVIDLVTIYYDEDSETVANVNGMCHDPTNGDVLYVTDAGIKRDLTSNDPTRLPTYQGNIYRIDLLTKTYEKLYDKTLYDNKEINSNGCIVNNQGIVFSIERRLDSDIHSMLEYNPNTNEFKSYSMPYGGDGLTINKDGSYLFYSEANGQSIFRIKKTENDEYEYDGILVTNLNGAGDICINYDENWIIAPSWPLPDGDGLYFIQLDTDDED